MSTKIYGGTSTMKTKRTNSMEDLIAENRRSNFKVIGAEQKVSDIEDIQIAEDAEEALKATYAWLINLINEKKACFESQKCIFGTIGFEVPVSECDPKLVEEIMKANGIPLIDRTPTYSHKTEELRSVYLLFSTPNEGIINMPLDY